MALSRTSRYSRGPLGWMSTVVVLAILASATFDSRGPIRTFSPTINEHGHGSPPRGWTLFEEGTLSAVGLKKECEASLYQQIQCDASTKSLTTQKFDGGDKAVVDHACTDGCSRALQALHIAVDTSCGAKAELVPGMPILDLVDRLWYNWNQSCFVDPDSGKNCNNMIAELPDVDYLAELSDSDICSHCFTHSLEMMQASKYPSAHDDELFKTQYRKFAKITDGSKPGCNLHVTDFEATPSVFNSPPSAPKQRNCVSGKAYVAKEGDTCDSIASTNMVSAATLFYTNPNILNCSAVQVGARLCLPLACERIWRVQPDDTCSSIALESEVYTQDIIRFNAQLNQDCSNLQGADPSWGSVVCTSIPGGKYAGIPASDWRPMEGASGRGSGYSVAKVSPPHGGSTLAPGTTLECGAWYTHDGSRECVQICLANFISIKLLMAANPSLGSSTCDSDLIRGETYCVSPLRGWDRPSRRPRPAVA
ncbi:LysM domain-containingprotein [Apiospora aurea]|uniref:LysM domain-containingprotein n=1 Tax=Apiospora aurea TaxID=335848 RepID=A0ABR1PWZ5_9PEZI